MIKSPKSQKAASEKLIRKVHNTLSSMVTDGRNINFYTVAKEANVSRTFLYKHPELRRSIERYRVTKLSKQELRAELSRLRIENLILEVEYEELAKSKKS